ncbi:MAG: hypothetical protein NTZ43_09590 [Gemmatimonadetes bacterium]|nr:hypothetical protein [Gemmatimonadota bacterium]
MFFAILEVLAFAVPVVGFANRRKAWGRSLAFASVTVLVVAYAAVPALRHHMVSDLRAGFTGW